MNDAEAFHTNGFDGIGRDAAAWRSRLRAGRPRAAADAGRQAGASGSACASRAAAGRGHGARYTEEWTGESGSSGHPQMQASEIRKAAANFESCLEGLWPLAQKRNISRASFDKYVTGLTPDLRIMDLMDAQPEFTKAFWDYLDILVSDARIQGGPRSARETQGDIRQGREGLRRRPLHHRRDLGRRDRTTARSAATGR